MDDWHDAEHHVDRAHDHFQAGRWADAEAELRRALAMRPDEPEWLFNLGLTLDAAQKHRDAATAFGMAHDLAPGDGHAATLAGASFLRADDPKAALPWLDKAQDANPGAIMPYVHRIEAYARLGQHDQAEVMFYLAQQVDPRSADALAAMGESLLDRGLSEKAIWCLKEALEIRPDLPGLRARLAEAHAAMGRLERARELYLEALRQDPGDVDVLLDLGSLLAEMNRPADAAEKFRRVLELEPDQPDAHFELGLLAERAGRPDEAIREFDLVRRLDPAFPGVRRRLAGLLMDKRGREVSAEQLLTRELEEFRAAPDAFENADLRELGELLLDSDRPADAAHVLSQLAEREPGSAETQHLLSVALLSAGRLDEGRHAARRALAGDPTLVAAMHNLAIASLEEGRVRAAARWLRKARRQAPGDASLRRLTWAVYWHAAAVWVARRLGGSRRPGPSA